MTTPARAQRDSTICRLACRSALGLMLALTASASLADPEPAVPEMNIVLKALPVGNTEEIGAIEVTGTIRGNTATPREPLVEMPIVSSNVPTVVTDIIGLEARDEKGTVALSARDIGEGDGRKRQWFPDRDVHGAVTLSYRVPIKSSLAPRGPAPPIELRAEAGAVSGGGSVFLLRPPAGSYRMQVTWDLDTLPPGAVAASSLDTAVGEVLPASVLDRTYFMAGRLQRYPQQGSDFFSVWQGSPPFDAPALMAWAERLREHYVEFFRARPTGYGIFMRRNPVNPGGGVGMYRSFVITFGESKGNDPEDLKLTLAHEMFHTFQPRMNSGSAASESSLADSWFNEGLAVFYQSALPLRYGMIDADAFLRNVNYHAARYYTNALGNLPNSEVPARFWEDTRVRTLPYDRGFLYFVTVDEAVRKASDGRRSLDDLMLEMRARQDRTGRLTVDDWEEVLEGELGRSGVAAFRAMLAGETPLPSSDAFGPCFRRVQKPMRRYELGFEPKVLTEPRRIVRGLIPGSAAEAAGLRNGDEILVPVGQDDLQGRQDGVLTLTVRRAGETLTISYKPRGETVDTWQWERASSSPGCVPAAARSSR